MAHFGIMRVEKRGRGAVYGLQIEANRTREEHEHGRDFDRSDIDWDKTDENVHLVRSENWNREITRQIREAGATERKNSVVLLDGLYTASPEWFEEHSRDEAIDFFRDCLAFHVREYCGGDASRVINAVVHVDEATLHLQVASVPIIEEEQGAHLSAKIIMGGRQDYRIRQDRFYEQVTQARGMERGDVRDDAERKSHTTKREWQLATQDERVEQLARETAAAEEELARMGEHAAKYAGSMSMAELEQLKGEPEKAFFGDEVKAYKLSPYVYKRLRTLARVGMERGAVEEDAARLRERVASVEQEAENRYRSALDAERRRADTAARERDGLAGELAETQHVLEFFPSAREQTATARAMEQAYDARSDSRGDFGLVVPFKGEKIPLDDFLAAYVDECQGQGLPSRPDMDKECQKFLRFLPLRVTIASIAAYAVMRRLHLSRRDSNAERTRSQAIRQTADTMQPVLDYVGIHPKEHVSFCRGCHDELDRQLHGEPPKEISGVGVTIDFRETAKTASSVSSAGAGQLQARLDVLSQALDALKSVSSGDGIVNLGAAMAASEKAAEIEDAIGVLKDSLASAEAKAEASAVLGVR